MEDCHVDELSDQESRDRAADGPHSLAEHVRERRLHIRHAAWLVDGDPPRGGRQPDREIRRYERVGNQPDGQQRNEPHATPAEVLVDDVGHDEHHRPPKNAGGEGERAGLAEETPAEGRRAERRLEREDLDAYELRDNRVGDEKAGENDKEPSRAPAEDAAHGRRFFNTRTSSRRSRLSGRRAGPEVVRRRNSLACSRAASLSAVSR